MNKVRTRTKRRYWPAKSFLRQELKEAYTAPEPERKQEFLQRLAQNRDTVYISLWQFFLVQAGYIKKWAWLVAAAVFGMAVWAGIRLGDGAVGTISACVPFLALTVLVENARSAMYGMEELEYATRFSQKSVLFARMGILAVFHAVLFAALILLGSGSAQDIALDGLYILVPYFITLCFGIWLLRRFHGREMGYACAAASVIVCGLVLIMQAWADREIIYGTGAVKWWLLALVLSVAFIAKEGYAFCKRTELYSMGAKN